jgi:putative signal transducing protein
MSTQAKSDPELVGVFETEQESEAMVVHGLLTSAGIESVVTSIDAPQNIFPGVGGVVVRVNAAQAEDARRLIDEYQNSPDNVEEVELDDSGEPAPE